MNRPSNEFYKDNQVYRKYQKIFDLSRTVFEFSDQLQEEVKPWSLDESLEAHLRDIASRIYPSSLKTFRSILYLCNEGHAEDAVNLARRVFENYVTLKYIRQNPEDRVYKFKYHPVLEAKFMLDDAKTPGNRMLPWLRKMILEAGGRILRDYEKIEDLYVGGKRDKRKALNSFKYGRWSGNSIGGMATELCLRGEYEVIFRLHSYFVHTRTFGLEYLCLESDTEVRYGAKATSQFVLLAVPTAARYLLLTLVEWADILGLTVDHERINRLGTDITDVETEYSKAEEL